MLSRRGALSARAKLNGSRRGPSSDVTDQPKPPFLARPFEAGMTGWMVVFGGGLVVLIGAAVTSRMSIAVTLPVLVIPVVIVYGFAVAQWWQVRASGADPANWWHLSGIVAALILWSLFPTVPNGLSSASSARAACSSLAIPSLSFPDCLHRAAQAFDYHAIAWWSAAGLIVVGALLARRSRIAAWAGIPTAIAGSALAASFLQQILIHFNVS
ncbi:MAG TPA: hypothetical protein VF070_41375 [Streptosporangiaceae bacterium]